MEGLRVSEVARLLGKCPDTLRRAERRGLIPPAQRDGSSGWRTYTSADVDLIRKAFAPRPPKESR